MPINEKKENSNEQEKTSRKDPVKSVKIWSLFTKNLFVKHLYRSLQKY